MCCRCLCNLRNSALELTLQNFVNLCNQRPPGGIRMHQIRFAPGLRPGPRWGSLRRSPRPPSRMGEGKPPLHTSPPRRLRRLGPGAFGACCFAPNLFFVPARLDYSVSRLFNCLCLIAPCGLRTCKNRPSPFHGRMT